MQTIRHTYKDYDGNEVTEDFYFNIRRDELAKNLHLKDEFEAIQAVGLEDPRQMRPEEVRKVFKLIEELLSLSYGIRAGENNRQFRKAHEHPEVWADFYESAAYDSFIFWLFDDTERVNNFMAELMPVELREEAAKIAADQNKPPVAPAELGKNPTMEELQEAYKEKMQRNAAEGS